MKYIQSFESLNEAKKSTIHRAAKKGSYPAVIVVVQDGKVIHQEPVSTPDIAPATFNVMQEKYPKALLHLEDNTGKRLFSESLVTEGQFSWMTQDTGNQIGSEKENTIAVTMFDDKGNKWLERKYDGY